MQAGSAPAEHDKVPIAAAGGISAFSDITGTGSADSTALLQPTRPWARRTGWPLEKAGIAEFDHGMSRQQAEKHATEHCISEWLYQHPMSSNAGDGCPVCGDADRPNDDLLPVGLGGGEVWLHRGCSAAWRAARIAEAITALGDLGIRRPEGSSP